VRRPAAPKPADIFLHCGIETRQSGHTFDPSLAEISSQVETVSQTGHHQPPARPGFLPETATGPRIPLPNPAALQHKWFVRLIVADAA
jgi:hypothetical protein